MKEIGQEACVHDTPLDPNGPRHNKQLSDLKKILTNKKTSKQVCAQAEKLCYGSSLLFFINCGTKKLHRIYGTLKPLISNVILLSSRIVLSPLRLQ